MERVDPVMLSRLRERRSILDFHFFPTPLRLKLSFQFRFRGSSSGIQVNTPQDHLNFIISDSSSFLHPRNLSQPTSISPTYLIHHDILSEIHKRLLL